MDTDDRLGHIVVAALFGPAMAVALAVGGGPVGFWVLGALNVVVATGVALSATPPVREVGAWWLVLSTVVGGLALAPARHAIVGL